jgi:hypothetical protein
MFCLEDGRVSSQARRWLNAHQTVGNSSAAATALVKLWVPGEELERGM